MIVSSSPCAVPTLMMSNFPWLIWFMTAWPVACYVQMFLGWIHLKSAGMVNALSMQCHRCCWLSLFLIILFFLQKLPENMVDMGRVGTVSSKFGVPDFQTQFILLVMSLLYSYRIPLMICFTFYIPHCCTLPFFWYVWPPKKHVQSTVGEITMFHRFFLVGAMLGFWSNLGSVAMRSAASSSVDVSSTGL